MDVFNAIDRRRSVRLYLPEAVPESVIEKALDAAILAPSSSNMQTMKILWVRDAARKTKLRKLCLGQRAAMSAAELVVVAADASLWKRNSMILLEHFKGDARMRHYYDLVIPFLYGWRILAPLKWLAFNVIGLFKPMIRRPWSARDIDEVAIKSAALSCQNFMLAVTAQGYDTCPMEGFDESQVKSLLKLSRRARVVMVIAVGRRDPEGVWGNRFRIPKELIVARA